jgi:hypothetical protein
MDDIEKTAKADSLDQEAAKHEAIAQQLRLHAEQARKGDAPTSQEQKPEGKKLPEGTPDYGKWTATSICSHPDKKADDDD